MGKGQFSFNLHVIIAKEIVTDGVIDLLSHWRY